MKILLVYPGQRHSTYDVALGYHEALEELGHIVIAYPFEDYVDYHAEAIRHWEDINAKNFHPTDEQRMDIWMRWASEPLIIYAVEHLPDLILIVSGLTLHVHTYKLLSRFSIPRAVILTESPYLDPKQAKLLTEFGIHMAFTNDKNSVETLREMTSKPVEYLPHSYSPKRHYPAPADKVHQSDVYFHGTWWPERAALFQRLNFNGCNVRIVGVGWTKGIGDTQSVTSNDELVDWYRGTKIALNHHRTVTQIKDNPEHIRNGAAWSIGPRAYEIAACGAFQLCDDTRPELGEIFGGSVATYSDAEDLQRKVEYYLEHEDERREMTEEALIRVIPCSFLSRAEQILLPAIRSL